MKRLLLMLALIVGCKDTSQHAHQSECPEIDVHFSPRGGVTQNIVRTLKETHSDVYVLAFSFTSLPIAEALVDLKKSGKTVEVVLDRENLGNKSSVIHLLYDNGIKIYIDDRHAIAHNKVIIIDKEIVFTGSANLTKAAEENNAENSVSITNSKIAETYMENWLFHKEHSYVYSPDQ